jgi:nitrogen fixation/metabolism regulation signal transduction histidine kinase
MQPPNESRSELAFEQLPQAIVVVDEDGLVERVNRAAEALMGASDAAPGAPVERAFAWLAAAVRCVLAGAHEAGLEAEAATIDGPRTLAARVRPLQGPGGPAGAVALVEDLTARRALDSRVRDTERFDALVTFAAGLAHEVNNPLAAVVACLSFVQAEHARLAQSVSPAELEESRAALEEARAAALRIGRVVRSLESFGCPAASAAAPVDLADAEQRALRSSPSLSI